jgi:hypothetical protein
MAQVLSSFRTDEPNFETVVRLVHGQLLLQTYKTVGIANGLATVTRLIAWLIYIEGRSC